MNARFRSFSRRQLISCTAFAALAILSNVVFADLTTKDAGPKAPDNKKALEKLIASCRKKSQAFDKLISDIENSKTAHVTITVGRGQGSFVDESSKGGKSEVNLTNLEEFPDAALDPKTGKPQLEENIPDWAATRCEVLAHIMGEAKATATAHAGFGVAHSAGIREQNKVRKNFKQAPPCSGSVNQPPKPRPFQYTQTSYNDKNEKVSYKDGKVSIRYFIYDNVPYEPARKKSKAP